MSNPIEVLIGLVRVLERLDEAQIEIDEFRKRNPNWTWGLELADIWEERGELRREWVEHVMRQISSRN